MEQETYKVKLENFYGPLDLLLYLVRENELDITRVTLAEVAQQYVSYMEALQKLDIDLAGEFVALASQLMLIKSRTVLPPLQADETEEEEEEDPSFELIQKLLEYKRYKDRAQLLQERFLVRRGRFSRPRLKLEGSKADAEAVLLPVELWDLVASYARIAKQIHLDVSMSILYHDTPLEVFIERILQKLTQQKSSYFSELVPDRQNKGEIVGTFLALLELVKEQKVKAQQEQEKRDIRVELTS